MQILIFLFFLFLIFLRFKNFTVASCRNKFTVNETKFAFTVQSFTLPYTLTFQVTIQNYTSEGTKLEEPFFRGETKL